MSGICGLVIFDDLPNEREQLGAMTVAAPHRAPDGVSTWHGRGAALASLLHRVTLQDEHDRQPLARAGLVLVADARIDNRGDLIPLLVRLGFLADVPDATPDSEVILAAHRCWGDAAPARLIGDFAYLLWDGLRRRVLAARDPMGMRPLYYRIEPRRRLVIASELTQILSVPGVPCDIDEQNIAATLAGPYLRADATVYRGIDQLAPGHVLAVDPEKCATRPFWKPDLSVVNKLGADECAYGFRERFARAVEDRLRTAKPVGLSLSGGVDSGSIAATAGWLRRTGQVTGPGLHTYSWAFRTMVDSDERAVSDLIVDHYGLHATAVSGDDAWTLAGYPEHGPDRDDPFIGYFQPMTERVVARASEDGMGVLLSGHRGDELLDSGIYDDIGLLLAGKVRAGARELGRAAHEVGSLRTALRRQLQPRFQSRLPPAVESRLNMRAVRNETSWWPWLRRDFIQRTGLRDAAAETRRSLIGDGDARSLRQRRIFSAAVMRIAVLNDRMRARRGIAFADPFTDRRLIEFVLALPQWQVQRRAEPKWLGRAAMIGIMPELARSRVDKFTPHSLFEHGFRHHAVPTVRELLTDSQAAARGWLDERAALSAYEAYVRTGRRGSELWWPIVVEMWLRRWWP